MNNAFPVSHLHNSLRTLLLTLFTTAALLVSLPAAKAHGPADYSALFEEAKKSVVNINSLKLRERGGRNPGQAPFPFPFPNPNQPDGGGPNNSPYRSFGFGSGFVIDIQGHIITNAHVILDEKRKVVDDIEVVTFSGKKRSAEVIGYDIYTDIALLKIDPEGLDIPVAKIGNSDNLKVGQTSLALGHPLGLDYSLTSGIISSLNRSLRGNATVRHVPYIQTDAAVNPGNSGGPLLNAQGEVIGVNARIISGRTAGFIGYSLAIPINIAMEVQQTLRSEGKIERGMLGVTFGPEGISEDDAKVWGIDHKRGGVLVSSIIDGSGAEAAGLMPGDIILEFDGKPILDPTNFPRYIADTKPGSKVNVLYFREGQEFLIEVTIGSIDDGGRLATLDEPPGEDVPEEPYGMVFAPLDDNTKKTKGVDSGVILKGFNDRNGDAAVPQELYKLQSNDIIIGVIIKGKLTQINNPSQLRTLLDNLDTDIIGFQIKRNSSRPFFVTVNLTN